MAPRHGGRLVASGPPLQQFPGILRQFLSAGAGQVLIDADYRSCHLRAASAEDEGLRRDLESGRDLPEWAGRALSVSRSVTKLVFNAWINGSDPHKMAEILGDEPAATRMRDVCGRRYPVLSALIADHQARGADGRRALSERWTARESQAMDYVLRHLRGRIERLGGRLIMSTYDGILVSAPTGDAEALVGATAELMAEGAQVSGIGGCPVTTRTMTTWGG